MPEAPMPPLPPLPTETTPAQSLEASPGAAAAGPRTSQNFGLKTELLRTAASERLNAMSPQFDWVRARIEFKAEHRRYRREARQSTTRGGERSIRGVLVRAHATTAETLAARHARIGQYAIQVVRQLGRAIRRYSGVPRKYGSAFDGPGAKGDVRTEVHSNIRSIGSSGSGGGLGSARAGIEMDKGLEPGMAAHGLNEAAREMSFVAVGTSMFDAAASLDGVVTLASGRNKAKQTLHRTLEDTKLFLSCVDRATPQEAEAYLDFKMAAEKIIVRTAEEQATQAMTVDIALRGGVIQPTASAIGASIGLASFAVDTTGAGIGLAPLSLVAAGLDFHQGRMEHTRRQGQKLTALQRIAAMETVLGNHPANALLAGMVNGLRKQQDELVRQAKNEKWFAKFRTWKASAAGSATLMMATMTGVALAGLVAGASLGIAAAVAAVPGLAGAAVLAVRDYRRWRAEHGAKWSQRFGQVIAMHSGRQEMEKMLSGTTRGERVKVAIGEGEYLAVEGRFAGRREVEVDVHEHPELCLEMLGMQIQDLLKPGPPTENSLVALELVGALSGDPLVPLALLKAASTRSAEGQLDFILKHLAPVVGIKLRMAGDRRPPPHVSVFLETFDEAWAGETSRHGSSGRGAADEGAIVAEVVESLRKRYSTPAAWDMFSRATLDLLARFDALPDAKDDSPSDAKRAAPRLPSDSQLARLRALHAHIANESRASTAPRSRSR